jgi:ketosteroid isomerase-like protein
MERDKSLFSTESERVHDANHRFYRAVETRDLAAMEALWLHAPFAHCVHSGREALVGWKAIRESWARLFRNTGWLRVTPTTLRVEVLGDIAILTCTENISSKSHDEVGLSVTAATNIFIRTDEGWRIFHHHASPAPVHVTHPFTGTIQ